MPGSGPIGEFSTGLFIWSVGTLYYPTKIFITPHKASLPPHAEIS